MAPNPLIEIFTELGVAWVVILFRIFARWRLFGIRKLQADDYLMVFAGVLYAGEAMAAYYVIYYKGLSIADMTDEQRAALDPTSLEWSYRVSGSKTFIAGWMTYTSLLWTLKTCILIFYSRLTASIHLKNMKLRIRIGAVALVVTYVTMVCVILFVCSPVQKHWQINPNPGAECHSANAKSNMYTMLIFNVLTDMYLIYLPIPVIWSAQLGLKRKVGLTTLLAGAIITTVFGFLRCIVVLTTPGVKGAGLAGLWSVRESFIAVVVTNIPLIFPYVSRLWLRLKDKTTSRGSSHQLTPYGNVSMSRGDMNGSAFSKSSRSKKSRNPYAVPGDTVIDANESEEYIIKDPLAAKQEGLPVAIHRTSSTDVEMNAEPWHSLEREAGRETRSYDRPRGHGIQVTTSVQVDESQAPQKGAPRGHFTDRW